MMITEAIVRLREIEAKHGDVQVFFDCPQCGASTRPDIIATVVEHTKVVMTAAINTRPSTRS